MRTLDRPKTAAPRRELLLKAAGRLFGRRGFHGTSTREVAEAAGISLGNIYNHFPTKEALFTALLAEQEGEYFSPDQPLPRALASGTFPDNLEEIGQASRETVRKFADYIRLMYVDVVEFDARHISRVFKGMRDRYAALLNKQEGRRPRSDFRVDPVAALMMTTWGFFTYFITEKLFGVERHYGMTDEEVIRLFAAVIRRGALHPEREAKP